MFQHPYTDLFEGHGKRIAQLGQAILDRGRPGPRGFADHHPVALFTRANVPDQPGKTFIVTGVGELRGPSRECSPSEEAQDPQLAKRLWDVSIAMTEIDLGLRPVG